MTRLVAIVTVAGFTCVACGDGLRQTISSPTPSVASTALEPTSGEAKQHNITGTIMSVEKPTRFVVEAKIEIVSGVDAGRFTHSDANGDFVLAGVSAGPVSLRVSKEGFETWTREGILLADDQKIGVELFILPPTDANGVSATGRCNDGSWTWALVSGAACTRNGGLAYGVCPGALCKSQ